MLLSLTRILPQIGVIFVIPLALTALIEVIVAMVLGLRRRHAVLAVILVNVMTNPLVNYLALSSAGRYRYIKGAQFVAIELLVVLVESLLLAYALRMRWRNALRVSFAMNVASVLGGIILWLTIFSEHLPFLW